MKIFRGSFLFTFICLVLAGFWGYSKQGIAGSLVAVFTTLILALMEISLSFDNAVVNAKILSKMSEKWQKIFLTWGILIAVFGMRLIFPVAIVSITTHLGFIEVINIALNDPASYEKYLSQSHIAISSFGGMFLLLVFFSFIFDEEKEVHWFTSIEKQLVKVGQLKSSEIIASLMVLMGIYTLAPVDQQMTALLSGLSGILIFGIVSGLSDVLEASGMDSDAAKSTSDAVKNAGFMTFLYLEVLDASFSFDGVIGAFAITQDVVIIMIGLGIGAMFVRSMTVFLVKKGTLQEYIFLEHGAHYAIGALAVIMLLSLKFHISEIFTGLIGVGFIILAVITSIIDKNKNPVIESV